MAMTSVSLLPNIVSDPTDWRAQNEAGMVMHRNHLLDQAVEHLTLAVQFGPPDSVARRNLSMVKVDLGTRYKLAGQIDLAMQCYLESIACNPHYAPAYFNCAVIHSERGQYEQALKYYQTAVQNNPNYVEALCVEETTLIRAKHKLNDSNFSLYRANELKLREFQLKDENGNSCELNHEPVKIHLQPLYKIKHYKNNITNNNEFHNETESRELSEYCVSTGHLVSFVWKQNTTKLSHSSLRRCSELEFYHIIKDNNNNNNEKKFEYQTIIYHWKGNQNIDNEYNKNQIESELWSQFHLITKYSIHCYTGIIYDLPVQILEKQFNSINENENILFPQSLNELICGIELNDQYQCNEIDNELLSIINIDNNKLDEIIINNSCYYLRSLSITKEEGFGTVIGLSVNSSSNRFLLHSNIITHNCNIGVIYKNSAQLNTAIDYYERALKVNPNFHVASSNLSIALTDQGTSLKNEGRIDDGISYYKRALHHNSKYAAAWYNLGVAFAEKSRFDDAKVCYEMCVLFDCKCAEAMNNLGVIYKDRGNLDQAVYYYHEALAANPTFSQTLNNLSVIYTMLGKLDEAYEYCLAKGTKISLTHGLNKSIETIHNYNNTENVWTFKENINNDSDGNDDSGSGLVFGASIKLLTRGIKKCVELKLLDGRCLICTPDHQILTINNNNNYNNYKWLKAEKIEIYSHRLMLGAILPDEKINDEDFDFNDCDWNYQITPDFILSMKSFTQRQRSTAFARLFGYAMASTTINDEAEPLSTLTFAHYNDAEAAIEDIKIILDDENISDSLSIQSNQQFHSSSSFPLSLSLPLSLIKLFSFDSSDGIISSTFPYWLTSSSCPRAVVREFIAGLCGKLIQTPKPLLSPSSSLSLNLLWSNIQISHTNSKFLESLYQQLIKLDVKEEFLMLNNFSIEIIADGFSSFVNFIGVRYSNIETMRMTISTSHINCIKQQSLSNNNNYPESLSQSLLSSINFINACGISLAFFSSPLISPYQPIPSFHLPVISIVDAGDHQTYDLEIPSYHNFISSGIIVHNCSRAIKSNPHYAEALNNLGVLYRDEGRIEEAIASYAECLKIDPTSKNASQNRLLALNSLTRVEPLLQINSNINNNLIINNNNGNNKLLERLNQTNFKTSTNSNSPSPLPLQSSSAAELPIPSPTTLQSLTPSTSANDLSSSPTSPSSNIANNNNNSEYLRDQLLLDAVYEAHRQWGLTFSSLYEFDRFTDWPDIKPVKDRVLRIGYLSADFFTHSVSYFIEAPLVHRDKNKFHVTCYSNVARKDKKTNYFESLSDSWRPIHDKTTKEVADLIKRDRIDILIECTGHTAGNRLDVCALKPAPIQITWIGYPNTTGLPAIDYRLTDSIVDPYNTTQLFTETLIRFNGPFLCYTPPQDSPQVSDTPALKNGFITFGSFNSLAKINDRVLSVWCSILSSVPYSRMLIKCKPFASPTIQSKIQAKFALHGILASRIDLISLLPTTSEHLDAYANIDISLDTFPYSGTTTTCEALHSGVPVITYHRLSPSTHSHGVGSTLISRLGEEISSKLIAYNENEFISLAVSLAADIQKLQILRKSLREKLLTSKVCDGKSLTQELESNLIQIWKDYCDKVTTTN